MSFSLTGNTITIQQGSTFQLSVNWTDSNGSTIDLTSYTARMSGRSDSEATSTVFSITDGSGITLGNSDPNVSIEIAAATTAAFDAPLLGRYDLELQSDGGTVYRILSGRLNITREITR